MHPTSRLHDPKPCPRCRRVIGIHNRSGGIGLSPHKCAHGRWCAGSHTGGVPGYHGTACCPSGDTAIVAGHRYTLGNHTQHGVFDVNTVYDTATESAVLTFTGLPLHQTRDKVEGDARYADALALADRVVATLNGWAAEPPVGRRSRRR